MICDMIEKWAPFFKLYSEYTSAYETITATFRDCMKNKKFAAIVAEIQVRLTVFIPTPYQLMCDQGVAL